MYTAGRSVVVFFEVLDLAMSAPAFKGALNQFRWRSYSLSRLFGIGFGSRACKHGL